MRTILAMARADFRERVRRTSFLVLLAGTVAAGYGYVPARSASYATFGFDHIGGLYNSAWVGTLVAMLDVLVLSLFGFYVVRDAVERDERTGVGQILATTRMTRPQYTLGKFLSNAAVLGCASVVTWGMAAVMQEVRGEVARIDFWQLTLPFLLLVVPAVAAVSALAVLFETFWPLRGARGSVLYFFLWIALLSIPASRAREDRPSPGLDPLGFTAPFEAIQREVRANFPDYSGGVNVGVNVSKMRTRTFLWEGMDWTPLVPWRLFWACVAVALAALAALPFHRFDPQRMPRRTSPERSATARGRRRTVLPRWTALGERLFARSRWLTVLWAEVAMLVRERRRGWALVAAGLWVAALLVPYASVREVLLPMAWVWPLAAWGGMGSQEARHRTEALLFVCPRPLALQLPASYVAGVLLTGAVGSGAALRFVAAHAWAELAAFAVATLFIPALALAAGVLSRGPRLFEASYLLIWYMGTLNGIPLFDFLAPTRRGVSGFFLATLALLALATAARARRVRG